jgi:DNA-binding XRE family transcriptional regulator
MSASVYVAIRGEHSLDRRRQARKETHAEYRRLLKKSCATVAREIRAQVQATKKASSQYRRHIATLKRQVTTLERQMALLQRRVLGPGAAAASGSTNHRVRFVAKGLKSHRNRLGFSAVDYGRLVGVSAQSAYNWEQGHASPRAEQLKIIATLRGIGKREAQARLHQLGAKGTNRRRKS